MTATATAATSEELARRTAQQIAVRRARRRRRRFVVAWFFAALLVGVVSFAGGLFEAPINFATPAPPRSALLLDDHGKLFATVRSPEMREEVPGNQIPKVMRDAIVAAEDERFYSHSGVDLLAEIRAALHDLTGGALEGGSTITQQYVKDVYVGDQRSVLRKLREAALAIRLERKLSKQEILTRYLNTLYLGNGAYGVQAASKFYFGVPISQLDYDATTGTHSPTLALARASLLAGLAPAPSVWNPVHDPKVARERQLYTLNQMIKNKFITSQQASAALGNGLPRIVAQSPPDLPTIAPEFRDYVRQILEQQFAKDPDGLYRSGLKVRTTLDLTLQQAILDALHAVLPKHSDPEAAVVAIDPRNGDIRAMAEKSVHPYVRDGFDLAKPPPSQLNRSSGSTIKPFTLVAALERGHSLNETHDAPQCISLGPGYRPCNAEPGGGVQTLASALINSVNTVYAPLALKVGLKNVIQVARRAGMIVGRLDRSCGGICPSYSLGLPTAPFYQARGYATIVNHGIRQPARAILSERDAAGATVLAAPKSPVGTRVIPRKIADEVTGVMQQVVDEGTGTAARQSFPVYGKTGTTDDFTNAWFTGCTHTLCISVWMGYNKGTRSMRDVEGVSEVFGGTLPARVFAKSWDYYRRLQAGPLPTPTPTATRTSTSTTGTQPVHTTTPVRTKRRSSRPSKAPVVHTQPPRTTPPPAPSSAPSPTSLLPRPP